jgi:hypothetical protein
MVDMNVCHVLLGKHYDRNVMYDGRCNTYTLNIKEKCIILAPIKEEEIVEGKSKNKLFLPIFVEKEKTKLKI